MPDQAVDYAALADQARSGTAAPSVDYTALAQQARGGAPVPMASHTTAAQPPPGQFLGASDKPASIGGRSYTESIRDRLRPWTPSRATVLTASGATIGGVIGGIPGATLGAASGKAYANLADMAETGKPPGLPPVTHALAGGPPPISDSPTSAGLKESGKQALGLAETGVESGALPEAGSRVLGSVLSGPLKPPPGAGTELAKVNEKLGLGLTAPELAGETARGTIASQIQHVGERSFGGRAIAVVHNRIARENATQGIATGAEGLARVGQALGDAVSQGPAYDMLPHHIEAARIFGEEIAPKLLDLHATLPKGVVRQLRAAASSPNGVSPQLALRATTATRAAIQKGSKEPIPIGSLDTLIKVLETKPTVGFGSGTALRTSLRQIGDKGDNILGEQGKALARKFTGDLTNGLSATYPDWDPLRHLYAAGARGLDEPGVKALAASAPPELVATVAKGAKALPAGREAEAIGNLRYISDALQRRSLDPAWQAKLYNAFELASTVGAGFYQGPAAAAGALATLEGIPTLVAWAAHNPRMTKLLTEGILSADEAAMIARIGQVYASYAASQGAAPKMAVSHPKGGPPGPPTPTATPPPK